MTIHPTIFRLLLTTICCLGMVTTLPAAERPPNIVLIISDDHHWSDYTFIRPDAPATPNIDQLAQEGITFTRGYVPMSLCRASLMTIVTGLYPHQHKTGGNDPNRIPDREEYDRQRERLIAHIDPLPTLPKMLKEAGYTSLQTGKWWEGNFARGGFDEGMTRGFPNPGGRHGDAGLIIGRETMQPIFDFIEKNKEQPFFIWYAPLMPHDPHTPPQELLDKYIAKGHLPEQAKYEGMVEWFDQTVGQLIEKLKQSGVYDNTVIIYVADNGLIPRTSETPLPDGWNLPFAPRSKLSPYEGGIRTPIIISGSKQFEPRRDDSTLISSIDIVPTILALTGAKRQEMPKELALPGLDLTEFIKTGTPLNRDTIFGECFGHDIPDVDDAVKGRLYRWCIEGKWKLILSDPGDPGTRRDPAYGAGRPQLFDLSADPAETQDIVAEHPEIVKRLTEKIDQWSPAPKHATLTAAERPPNILVIIVDDMGFSDLGCYGGEIETPNIDQLAQNGLRFTQFYNTARCWPTRTALMTGFYPQQVRSDPRSGNLPQGTVLIPHYLQSVGYRSYHSGKWHVPGANRPRIDGGFNRAYVLDDHDRHFYPRNHREDDEPLAAVNPDNNGGYYTTTFITEKFFEYLREHLREQPATPFFAHVAYTAPHFPLQAPQEMIDKYRDRYHEGWDSIRQKRYENLTAAGMINTALSPREENVGPPYTFDNLDILGPGEVFRPTAWNTLTETQKKFQAEKMAIYAAMIDCVDQEVGRIIAELKKNDLFDNTAIFILSDNGSSAEIMVRGDGHDPQAAPGSGKSYLSLGPGWSTVANTPFRRHKVWTHEGGISTPLVVHWTKGISEKMQGSLRHEPGHVIDFVPTFIEMSGAAMEPNKSGLPLAGKSLLDAIQSESPEPVEEMLQRDLYFSHEGNGGIRSGSFKAVSTARNRQGDGQWRLYDLNVDRAETVDLSAQHLEKLRELVERWEATTQRFAEDSQRP